MDKAFGDDPAVAMIAIKVDAFWGMISRSMRLEIQQRKVQLPNAMKQFADAFTGTSYADRALNEAQTIAMGQLSQ